MPSIKCPSGKWKWGEHGECVYSSKRQADAAGIAILIERRNKLTNKINKEWKKYGDNEG